MLTAGHHALAADAETEEAFRLLQNMSKALRETDYRGLFTYEYGGALKTMRITHQVADGMEYEYLEYLNGPPIRVERGGISVDCLPPADQVLRGMIPALNGNSHGLNQHYYFRFRGDDRIAERHVSVMQIIPRDPYRYGYTLFIDKQTFLPLGSMVLNASNRVLERLQFSSLEVVPTDDWIEVVESNTRVSRPQWPSCASGREDRNFAWQVSWIPSGFMPAGESTIEGVGDVRLFTDGLSAFSVFVRPSVKAISAQGKAQRGATVAYMKQEELNSVPHTITIVGEIPARTAQRIAASVLITEPDRSGLDGQ